MIISAQEAADAVIKSRREVYERALHPIMEEIQMIISQGGVEAIITRAIHPVVREHLHKLGYRTFDYGNAVRVSFAHLMPEEPPGPALL